MPAAFHVDLRPPGAWRLGCRALLGLALWAGTYWLGAVAGLWPPGVPAAGGCAALALLLAGACPPSVLPGASGRLSWDGGGWHWLATGASRPLAGVAHAALDLGPVLLLRVDAAVPTPRRRSCHWLVVTSGALSPPVLQALRVALYCRRPEATRADHRDAEPDE
ncbi:hypothetical protein [Aquabacterium sp. J223]|uniref:hypothetical protein n=1 Tax=Aquabacterium sp. J223 TaxID=2898431 RepID=UPI0021AD6AF1|nr:hypothetical protein [Aquabacterium sp. J223]UUX96792.1 hypothetical protein LRS07_05790 [Aquabacterium sp. J223]